MDVVHNVSAVGFPSYGVGSPSERLNSPLHHQPRQRTFNVDNDDDDFPLSPTPLRQPDKRKTRRSTGAGSTTSSSPSPYETKHSRIKSPSTSPNDNLGGMVTTATTSDSQRATTGVIDKRINDILRYMLVRCLIPPNKTHFIVGAPVMPSQFLDYVTGLLGEDPIRLVVPGPWTAPKFQDVHDYSTKLCRENRTDIPFGIYEGESLTIYPTGRVECWDGDTDSFRGEGTLIVNIAHHIKEHIKVVVLGCIAGTGTGVLIDYDQRVWLYNPPNAVDQFIPGTSKKQASVAMKSGDFMHKDTVWRFVETYPESALEFDPESDSESSDDDGIA